MKQPNREQLKFQVDILKIFEKFKEDFGHEFNALRNYVDDKIKEVQDKPINPPLSLPVAKSAYNIHVDFKAPPGAQEDLSKKLSAVATEIGNVCMRHGVAKVSAIEIPPPK